MSKMGQFVFEMQEAAMVMTKADFISEYGNQYEDIYDQVYNDFVCDDRFVPFEAVVAEINDQIPF